MAELEGDVFLDVGVGDFHFSFQETPVDRWKLDRKRPAECLDVVPERYLRLTAELMEFFDVVLEFVNRPDTVGVAKRAGPILKRADVDVGCIMKNVAPFLDKFV